MALSTWKAGTVTVPASTGSMAITGLNGAPAAVFFFGTNWLTEDAAETSTGRGLFRGMAAPQYNSPGTLLQNAASVVVAGDAHEEANHAILMLDTGGAGTQLYVADVSSLDSDGFTLNWTTVASGGYKVVYVALMNVDHCGAYVGSTNGSITLGWKAGAAMVHGAWAGPTISGADRTQEFYGSAAFPGSSTLGWYSAGANAFTFPTSSGQQYDIELTNDAPTTRVTTGGHFIGPFHVTSNIRAFPSGGSLFDFTFDGDGNDGGMLVAWSDEDNQTGALTLAAATGNTATVSGLPFSPGLVIGYTVSDEPTGLSSGAARGAIGFSVVTGDFQWCALADGYSSRGAFQSFQRGVVDVVNGTSVHAGSVDLTAEGFVVTTQEDDVSPDGWLWHAFGHPVGAWTPQIYRRVVPA